MLNDDKKQLLLMSVYTSEQEFNDVLNAVRLWKKNNPTASKDGLIHLSDIKNFAREAVMEHAALYKRIAQRSLKAQPSTEVIESITGESHDLETKETKSAQSGTTEETKEAKPAKVWVLPEV